MKGRNGSTSFLPLMKKGGLKSKAKSKACLTKEQAKQVCDKIELGDKIKIRKIMQQNNAKLPKQLKERKDVNQYEKVLISDRNMIKNNSQMEQWSILSNNIVYGEECQILLDMGASMSYMSKSYYMRCKTLHDLPKFPSKTQRIQVGNGQYVGILFVIPFIIEINGHRLEVFTLVSEIFDIVDMVLGIKNLFKLEGVIDSRESSFRFLSRSIPYISKRASKCKTGRKEIDTD